MKKTNKIIICCLSILALFVCGLIGFLIGQNKKFFRPSKSNYVNFYTVKKNAGKELNQDEKKAIKLFIMSYEECLANDLDETEKEQLLKIQKEVLDIAEGNSRIKFNVMKLNNVKNGGEALVKKVRKCQRGSYKHITKEDKRLIRSALSKTAINDIIAIYHGIR